MITVCSITGINPIEHMEAIYQTQKSIPRYTKMKFKFIPGMTLESYSRYVILELPALIQTEHVLICQADGYGRNPELWDDQFLDFDYIGAPFPNGQVGNGGLSLRSKRFLEASLQQGEPNLAEDAFLCQYRRKEMEALGMKFAPIDVALRFSFEYPVEGYPWDATRSWGFHRNPNL